MSKVKEILSVFTKTIQRLEDLSKQNRKEASIKTAKADVLDQEAGQLLDEAKAADKAAGKLKGLLEDDV